MEIGCLMQSSFHQMSHWMMLMSSSQRCSSSKETDRRFLHQMSRTT
jgi:hypothetical protein